MAARIEDASVRLEDFIPEHIEHLRTHILRLRKIEGNRIRMIEWVLGYTGRGKFIEAVAARDPSELEVLIQYTIKAQLFYSRKRRIIWHPRIVQPVLSLRFTRRIILPPKPAI